MALIGPSVRLTTHCYVVTKLKLRVDVLVVTLFALMARTGTTLLHLLVVYLKTPSVTTENCIASNRVSFDREIRKGMGRNYDLHLRNFTGFFWSD